MNKFFASIAIVFTFLSAVGIVAINSTSPAWEIIADADLQNEGQKGGDCYILGTIQNCPPGDSTGCTSTLCTMSTAGSFRCPLPNSGVLGINGPTAKVQKTEYYYPNVNTSEGGADGYSSKTIVCIETQYCGGCVADDNGNAYYCGADPNPTNDERDAVKLSSQLCQ